MTTPVRALALLYMQQHSADAAKALERLPPPEVATLLASAPVTAAAATLEHLGPSAASRCLARIPARALRKIVIELPVSAASSVLRRLPQSAQEDALADMPERVRGPILRAIRFPALSAGAMADTHAPVLRDDDTVSEAVRSLRESGEPIPSSVLVLNGSWQVVGSVTAGKLLVASAGAKIRELGVDQARTVPANVPVASLAGDERRLGQPLAVVDAAGAVVGVLTERVLRDVAKQGPASPTMHLVASAGELYWLGLSWVLGSFTANPRSAMRSHGKAGSDD